LTDCSEIPKINFHKNPSDGSLFQAARSKDGRTHMIQLTSDFLNCFAKAPKMFGVTSFHFYAFSHRNCERQLLNTLCLSVY